MNDVQRRAAAKHFAEFWKGKGYEKGESQKFWLSLLQNVCGVEHPEEFISFEDQVHLDHTSFIDGYIPSTHVLIEQKGLGKNLRSAIPQSDGTKLKPIQQAQRYSSALPYSQRPRWIVICNFECFHIYDMEHPQADPLELLLSELPEKSYLLDFLTRTEDTRLVKEMEISIQAGELVGRLYDALLRQYRDPTSEGALRSLNALCVRLVFCLYAEDAGIFGSHNMFHDYLLHRGAKGLRKALIELFRVLDQRPEERDKYLAEDDPELAAFPYVNGGLFRDEAIEIPAITEEIYRLLLDKASADFDWSAISPTIFGAVFESTLNPETRRKGGMHYTSIENIHKVIDPLFLDDLRAELAEIRALPVKKTREQRLRAYQGKLASLKFLDPAAGSGNFLTESYLCLRDLENEVIKQLYGDQIVMGVALNPIQVSITQFYGIEINDFAVSVARTALWIAESQMLRRTEDIVHMPLDFLPLKTQAKIVEGNALRIDWESVVPREELNYIMGNPPFVGQQLRSKPQSEDMAAVFGQGTPETKLDYVLCWYKKALDVMNQTSRGRINAAFVSTSSICQGESVPTFWKRMSNAGIDIGFAYKPFKWSNESSENAAVVCIILGFTNGTYRGEKYLYDADRKLKVSRINAYLQDAPDIWITSRKNDPPVGLPKMIKGSEPTDGGNLFLSADEQRDYASRHPQLKKYIKPFIGGDEFLSNKQGQFSRYCLWMLGGNPADFANIPEIKSRLINVAQKRAASSADRIRKRAEYPYLFCQIRQPQKAYLLFPRHSSSERRYIPIGFMSSDVIVGDACYIIPDASLYMFGVLISNIHMAWMRLVCGRLGNGYRYSPSIYNNFPWPAPPQPKIFRIEQTAQAILDARALYPDCSLADLYDELTMPPELRKAHQANDRAVMEAYGIPVKGTTESACVAELMRRYQQLTR